MSPANHTRSKDENAATNLTKDVVWVDARLVASAAIERLGESGATHDSQSASRSGVEAWVGRNLNGWDDSDAGLSKG